VEHCRASADHPEPRHQIYFDKIHPSVPMIHKYRYLAAMNLYVGSPLPYLCRVS
jgi:hypothetical protein